MTAQLRAHRAQSFAIESLRVIRMPRFEFMIGRAGGQKVAPRQRVREFLQKIAKPIG
ncbi:hypothetical protein [Burkholderia sp. Ac-20353]|uniref:hypothetical protein n=1 Tax=Burkholderia sp. Ac-20353 TaxID=2703894 RepID=UPI00197CA145|nr:hypothetical protein [Burkholderia sp. Ac-20353]MBN3790620.1 hypothetical protein [Burkholderia sp. Ac-20353]